MERIGEYGVRRLVGEGGMGKVYEAEERLTERRVALKVLRPELTRSEEGRKLFLSEMRILAHLEHPHIVRSLASMEEGGQLVLVLEFLEGRTVREELVSRGPLPWREAVEIVGRVAEALTAAHKQSPPIIHRDLKPENVMLTAEGGLKVMDFGIAKVLEAARGTSTQSLGTLQYMSPEQIDAKPVDPRTDLYALGLVFYELLSGEPPFRSASPRELLNLQCTTPPADLPEEARRGVPRAVETLLFELLEKSPAKRPESAQAVVDRLAAFRAHAVGSAAPVSGPARIREPPVASPPASPPASSTPASSRPRAVVGMDTVALVEKAASSRKIATPTAVAVILLLSFVTGVGTYGARLWVAASESVRPAPVAAPAAASDGRATAATR